MNKQMRYIIALITLAGGSHALAKTDLKLENRATDKLEVAFYDAQGNMLGKAIKVSSLSVGRPGEASFTHNQDAAEIGIRKSALIGAEPWEKHKLSSPTGTIQLNYTAKGAGMGTYGDSFKMSQQS